ncbi:thiamine pyrophosphate-dependent enzyme [Methanogenium organophilum]|uniref:Thiamine pyrophosphate-dependent enzyme n=1 Tax=Methanogenium organophilum TaxID=2199 RepID=A0A9X9T915_METOG|nr:thiamine pyrophosphate-dependent enzyme [Methanogenium organophilum]WAI01976.1 thiamine pyrophosphate-dependent enzyme [Methanogenium organophilum]
MTAPAPHENTGEGCLAAALRTAADCFYTVPGYPVTTLGEACGAVNTINEKVALEYALGDAVSGRRACVILKNVGLNACMDPLMNVAVQGLSAGAVIVVGDDTEVKGSQNAQDSRCIGRYAEVPLFSPEADDLTTVAEAAFQASEHFSRIAMVRVTPAVLATAAEGTPPARTDHKGTIADSSLTMRGRAEAAEMRQRAMVRWAQEQPVPALVYPPHQGRVPSCSTVSPPAGDPETMHSRGFARTFCRECPYIPLLEVMQEKNLHPVLDIGCGLLAKNPPWEVGITGYGLGSSPAVAATSTGVALIGDYALMHSGLSALADIREKGLPVLVVIVENGVLGMTGKQAAPDILPYINWASPVIVTAVDTDAIRAALVPEDRLKCVIIRGTCPDGEDHETVEC